MLHSNCVLLSERQNEKKPVWFPGAVVSESDSESACWCVCVSLCVCVYSDRWASPRHNKVHAPPTLPSCFVTASRGTFTAVMTQAVTALWACVYVCLSMFVRAQFCSVLLWMAFLKGKVKGKGLSNALCQWGSLQLCTTMCAWMCVYTYMYMSQFLSYFPKRTPWSCDRFLLLFSEMTTLFKDYSYHDNLFLSPPGLL